MSESIGLPVTCTQIANQKLQTGDRFYGEMNAVPRKAFSIYEPGNTNHELDNNGRCVSIMSIVTRLQVVMPSSLGSIRNKGIPYK